MFFFLVFGPEILQQIRRLIPLDDDDQDVLLDKFVSVSRATLKGTGIIGIIQGGLAGGAFAVAGISGAVFWGAVMTILSIIPGIGTALVWIPAVIYLLSTGRTGPAIALALWCAVVVGTADNFLRPMLVGKDTQMPGLMVMLSTFGGLAMFGAVGFIIGPVIASLFLAAWKIYSDTFGEDARVELTTGCCTGADSDGGLKPTTNPQDIRARAEWASAHHGSPGLKIQPVGQGRPYCTGAVNRARRTPSLNQKDLFS